MSPELHFALWLLLAVLVAAVISFAATPLVKKLAIGVGAVDVPKDNRRMHKVPTPRLGGLAIFAAFIVSVLLFAEIDRASAHFPPGTRSFVRKLRERVGLS